MRATNTIPTAPSVLQEINTELDRRELTVVDVPDRPLRPLVPEGSADFDDAYDVWAASLEVRS